MALHNRSISTLICVRLYTVLVRRQFRCGWKRVLVLCSISQKKSEKMKKKKKCNATDHFHAEHFALSLPFGTTLGSYFEWIFSRFDFFFVRPVSLCQLTIWSGLFVEQKHLLSDHTIAYRTRPIFNIMALQASKIFRIDLIRPTSSITWLPNSSKLENIKKNFTQRQLHNSYIKEYMYFEMEAASKNKRRNEKNVRAREMGPDRRGERQNVRLWRPYSRPRIVSRTNANNFIVFSMSTFIPFVFGPKQNATQTWIYRRK